MDGWSFRLFETILFHAQTAIPLAKVVCGENAYHGLCRLLSARILPNHLGGHLKAELDKGLMGEVKLDALGHFRFECYLIRQFQVFVILGQLFYFRHTFLKYEGIHPDNE